MDLIERYLQAVKGYLPADQQDDIAAELKDGLLSQVEDREAGLGRKMTADELTALIKQSGHPMLVASRYLPQQYLISPGMYPFWWASMRIMLLVVGLVYVLLAGISMFTNAWPIQSLIHSLIHATNGFFETALFYAAVVTLVFWLFERNQVRFGFLDCWNPAKLAAVQPRQTISRVESLFEIVAGVLFVLWWIGVISFATQFSHHGKPVPFAMSSAWEPYWWPILVLGVGEIGLAVVNLVSPYWRWDRLMLRILFNVISIGIAWLLFQEQTLIVVADNAVEIARQVLLNKLMHGLLAILALTWLLEIFGDVRRLFATSDHT